jgi:hypothetical protein
LRTIINGRISSSPSRQASARNCHERKSLDNDDDHDHDHFGSHRKQITPPRQKQILLANNFFAVMQSSARTSSGDAGAGATDRPQRPALRAADGNHGRPRPSPPPPRVGKSKPTRSRTQLAANALIPAHQGRSPAGHSGISESDGDADPEEEREERITELQLENARLVSETEALGKQLRAAEQKGLALEQGLGSLTRKFKDLQEEKHAERKLRLALWSKTNQLFEDFKAYVVANENSGEGGMEGDEESSDEYQFE